MTSQTPLGRPLGLKLLSAPLAKNKIKIFKKGVDNNPFLCYNKDTKRKERGKEK
jgi:hypothetical protein